MRLAFVKTGLALLCLLAVYRGVRVLAADRIGPSFPSSMESVSATATHAPDINVDSLSRAIVAGNVFSPARTADTVPTDPWAEVAAVPVPPAKPVLQLTGILWSATPTAVVEGFPGQAGPRVVRAGEAIGEFTVLRISRSDVHVTGMDTTWTLRLKGRGSG